MYGLVSPDKYPMGRYGLFGKFTSIWAVSLLGAAAGAGQNLGRGEHGVLPRYIRNREVRHGKK
jgi:hypothetical protein